MKPLNGIQSEVEAYTASWIEIVKETFVKAFQYVEVYTASWIEILPCWETSHGGRVEAYTALQIEILYRSF